jgi:uncharacterized membrane protein YraQ (UPF0718 family)
MQAQASVEMQPRPGPGGAIGLAVFLALAVVGLYLVKWDPYFHKAFAAAAHHSIGASIVTGTAAAAPAPGWRAALGFAVAYGKDIWQAFVVGLVLGAGVQALIPRSWLLRLLGGARYRGIAVGAAAAVPSMM